MRAFIKLIILAGLVVGFLLVYGILDFNHGFMKDINSLNLELIVADNIKYVQFGDRYFLSVVVDGQLYAGFVTATSDEMNLFIQTQRFLGKSVSNVSYLWMILFALAAIITLAFPGGKKKTV